MRRKSFDALVSFGGLLMVVVLLAAGALLFWGYSYANNSVSSQLSAQKIDFPTKAALATAANPKPGGFSEVTPAMVPYLEKYAGQELTTGAQAQAYANHFIQIHLQEMTGGQTYSQVSAAAMAAPPGSAKATALNAEVDTVFKGTTLRSMLLNAYGWWQMGQIALISSVIAFIFAGITLVLSGLGLWHFRRAPVDEEIPRLTTTGFALPASNGKTDVTVGGRTLGTSTL
jgi:hypothetical protein